MINTIVILVFWGGIQFVLTGAAIKLAREQNWSKAALLGGMAAVWALAFFGTQFWGWNL